jgi:RHS repeat-associated protein
VETVTTTATPNNVNEVITQSGGVNRTLTYDLNGSLVNDGSTRTFQWDGANRLVAVNYTGTTKRSEFSYDGLSRVARIVEKTGNKINSTRKFVWCGMEQCEFRDAHDAVTLRVYPQGQYSGNKAYFYSRDHLGSIREMRKSTDTVVARYDYDPYGRSTTIVSNTLPDFNFAGLYRHSLSNLDFAVRRAYDPDLGRWLSRDPIGETGGVNLYSYVENNPTGAVDPMGLVTFFIHGTWGKSTESFPKDFYHHVMTYYGDPNARFFNWSGANTDAARQQAAWDLAQELQRYHRENPCESIQVVAHSHGGNVALLASQFPGVAIDELVTLGTPILAGYQPSDSIGSWYNISSSGDWVQNHAYPYTSAARYSPLATNIRLDGLSHIQLHTVAGWDAAFGQHP